MKKNYYRFQYLNRKASLALQIALPLSLMTLGAQPSAGAEEALLPSSAVLDLGLFSQPVVAASPDKPAADAAFVDSPSPEIVAAQQGDGPQAAPRAEASQSLSVALSEEPQDWVMGHGLYLPSPFGGTSVLRGIFHGEVGGVVVGRLLEQKLERFLGRATLKVLLALEPLTQEQESLKAEMTFRVSEAEGMTRFLGEVKANDLLRIRYQRKLGQAAEILDFRRLKRAQVAIATDQVNDQVAPVVSQLPGDQPILISQAVALPCPLSAPVFAGSLAGVVVRIERERFAQQGCVLWVNSGKTKEFTRYQTPSLPKIKLEPSFHFWKAFLDWYGGTRSILPAFDPGLKIIFTEMNPVSRSVMDWEILKMQTNKSCQLIEGILDLGAAYQFDFKEKMNSGLDHPRMVSQVRVLQSLPAQLRLMDAGVNQQKQRFAANRIRYFQNPLAGWTLPVSGEMTGEAKRSERAVVSPAADTSGQVGRDEL